MRNSVMARKTALAAFAAILACALLTCVGCEPTHVGQVSSTSQQSQYTASGEKMIEVALSGGTGKASIESPAKLTTEDDGSLTLTVVWSSSNYDKMVVGGVEYLPVTVEGGSTFEITVPSVDKDLPVQAETTAMSTPHMIDYVISFSVENDAEEAEGPTTVQMANFHNADIGNGWQVQRSLDLRYAKCFTVDYFEGGYKLFCLSDGGRYLTVPEGAEVPEGIADDIVVIQQPLADVYLVASDTMCLFDALDALDSISVSGISQDNWYIDSAVKAMQNGKIAYGGKYSAPDYELLLGAGVRLAIESTMINHTPTVREKLIELGIPVFVEMSSYESEPLGRTEWVKCYGAMLDREDDAQALFDEQAKQVESLGSAVTGKTVAFFYINSNGSAIVRRPGDYVTKMIEQAGGSYVFDSLDQAESSSSSVTLEMEQFYAMGHDADIIIYNSSIDGSVNGIDDLIRKNALLEDFTAVKNGDVWATSQNMYQQMMQTGAIIADFNTIFSNSGAPTAYVNKLG